MLSKGEEMGQFNLGSTVLLLFPETSEIQWFDTLKVGGNLRMGEIIARISNHQKQTWAFAMIGVMLIKANKFGEIRWKSWS